MSDDTSTISLWGAFGGSVLPDCPRLTPGLDRAATFEAAEQSREDAWLEAYQDEGERRAGERDW
jgi:hypothetical protein